eukprot:TRINITY_DN11150_c0_g1_i1.p1 TRINITY_DN11150_c0_g1~~TRINITY_DN11150_c0_g1_i1.p1  ORF type:complete len:269 (-),score=41.78 TRINITY_DN11150_c0_g1_i1:253-993(-)
MVFLLRLLAPTFTLLGISLLGEGAATEEDYQFIPLHQHSEEDELSAQMPEGLPLLKCDLCIILTQHLAARFQRQEAQKKRNLKESEYLEVVETTCDGRHLLDYGVKPVNNVTRFDGPGTCCEDVLGIKNAGGIWHSRLIDGCLVLIDEVDNEDELYSHYRKAAKEAKGDGAKAAQLFVSKLCLQEQEDKKKKKKKSTKVTQKCPKEVLWFNAKSYAKVQAHIESKPRDLHGRPDDLPQKKEQKKEL